MAKSVPWFLAVLAVALLLLNIFDAVQKDSMGVSTIAMDFWVDADGTAKLNTFSPPIRPLLANVVFRVQEHRSMLGGELWQSSDWSIDIQPVSAQPTPLQRQQIIEQMFDGWTPFMYLKGRTPPQAITAVPPPGMTVVTGSDFVLHRWGFVRSVVAGWPTGLGLLAGVIAWMIWLTSKQTPREVDRSVCGACGYSREGLALGAPCPECGLNERQA